ncbi:MAG: PD-(D/E)XK nuclease family protein, partial [Holophagae bacterium]|nr:PD-(D/E)XK nuclease family protein [Holophagae bacterium]
LYRRAVPLAGTLDTPVIIAGFGALTVSEHRFFSKLFKRGDCVVLFQTDLKGRHPNFHPYRIFDSWMSGKLWEMKPERIECEPSLPSENNCRFFESFDIHSQATQLYHMLSDKPERFENTPTDAAVVLPATASLIPVLQVIPQNKLNVTAGYPFSKTGFFRLMNALMELGLKTADSKLLYISIILKIMSNPLVRPLLAEGERPDDAPSFEQILLENGKNLMTEAQLKKLAEHNGCDAATSFFQTAAFPFIKARSLLEIGNVLETLAVSILKALPETAAEGPEKRMLRNFIEQILPRFNNSRYRETLFTSPRILFMLVRHLASAISVRFEGNPLEGLQVMGFLESRMLSFEHVFVLDVNEGILPAETPPDPLLPTGLRPALGLPGPKQREMVHDYHFYRLVDSAKNVSLFYRKGETSERKSIRSRYIEQLLFEEGKKAFDKDGKLAIRDFEKEKVRSTALHLVPLTKTGIHVLAATDLAILQSYFEKGISASFLDELLQCPHRFYLKRVLKLPEETTLREGQDPREVGTLVHEALENGFKIAKDKQLTYLLLKTIENGTKKEANRLLSDKLKNLSPTHLELLLFLAEKRLEKYFSLLKKDLAKKEITIAGLEDELRATLDGVKLFGKIDRLDKVKDRKTGTEEWRVVDYKTGSFAQTPGKRGWDEFLSKDAGEDFPDKLSQKLHSIQLPLYSFLVSRKQGVPFAEVASELFLLGKGEAAEFKGKTLGEENFIKILNRLLGHLQPGTPMNPTEQHDHCQWCPYAKTCRFSVHSV